MKSYIEKWAWIASNDSAFEFVYFLESLGTDIGFPDIFNYCDLEEKKSSLIPNHETNHITSNQRIGR